MFSKICDGKWFNAGEDELLHWLLAEEIEGDRGI